MSNHYVVHLKLAEYCTSTIFQQNKTRKQCKPGVLIDSTNRVFCDTGPVLVANDSKKI